MTEKTATKPMDVERTKRGIRATEIGLAALDKLFRRDVDSIRNQLDELQRSIELGEPTEFVRRFAVARQVEDEGGPEIALDLAHDILFDAYHTRVLNLCLWSLLSFASGYDVGDDDAGAERELEAHIRRWCHGGAIELPEETERSMFEAAGLPFKRARVERCEPGVFLADYGERSIGVH